MFQLSLTTPKVQGYKLIVKSPTVEKTTTLLAFIVKIRDQRPLPLNLVILTTKTLRSKKLLQATRSLTKTRTRNSNQKLLSMRVPDSSIKQLFNSKQFPYASKTNKVLWTLTPSSIPVVQHLNTESHRQQAWYSTKLTSN